MDDDDADACKKFAKVLQRYWSFAHMISLELNTCVHPGQIWLNRLFLGWKPPLVQNNLSLSLELCSQWRNRAIMCSSMTLFTYIASLQFFSHRRRNYVNTYIRILSVIHIFISYIYIIHDINICCYFYIERYVRSIKNIKNYFIFLFSIYHFS